MIELARVMREKHRLPTKTPLKSMMVVHSDSQFLADIAGDLLPYVLEEMNVREVHTCNDPMQYSSVKASPQWGALGKRVGKSMPQVKTAMQVSVEFSPYAHPSVEFSNRARKSRASNRARKSQWE